MKYNYEFSIWPTSNMGNKESFYALIKMINGRIEMEFTELGFQIFRKELLAHNITLREVTRTPFHLPEYVK